MLKEMELLHPTLSNICSLIMRDRYDVVIIKVKGYNPSKYLYLLKSVPFTFIPNT